MKKLILFLFVFIITLIFSSCNISSSSNFPENNETIPFSTYSTTISIGDDKLMENFTLIVNGKDITKGNYVHINHTEHYAEIPFIAVIQELGAKVEWRDNIKAEITYNKKKYILDISNGTLVEKWDKHQFNNITPAPGQTHKSIRRATTDELIVDSSSAKWFIVVKMGAKINIDCDNNIVTIGYWEYDTTKN